MTYENEKGSRTLQLLNQDGKPCKLAAVLLEGKGWVQIKNREEGEVEISWDRSLKNCEAKILFGWSGGTTTQEMNDWIFEPFELIIK